MVHPKPATAARAALYGYLVGRETSRGGAAAPGRGEFEAFKAGRSIERVPDVPFQMLTALDLGPARVARDRARRRRGR